MKKLKIDLLYGTEALTLPAVVLDKLSQVDEAELKVLLCLCDADTRAAFDTEAVADRLGLTPEAVTGAIQFWRGADVLKKSELKHQPAAETESVGSADHAAVTVPDSSAPAAETDVAPAPKAETPKASVTIVRSDDGTPHYTAEEIDRIFAENGELSGMIDECQNIFGKLFNPTEVNKIMALTEYFRLDCEYILLLCYYCRKIGKSSVPYLDKLARSLYNEGIDNVDSLGDRLGELEAAADLGGYYRTLSGAGKRTFTDRESKFLSQWVKWSIKPELLKLAYEVSVDATGAPSMPYINKVLSNWKEAGYTTAEQVKSAMEEYKQKKENRAAAPSNSTFDTDEFFEAALKRTLAIHQESKKN
ncbi:MAG: DnaD domain protein [Clostridia bacterium]|nr:DnaD domain protein [Clostridia bacterium]